jgi:hypothetical protein
MERNTVRARTGNALLVGMKGKAVYTRQKERDLLELALNKLTDYEDTGLNPQEVNQLAADLEVTKSVVCEKCRHWGLGPDSAVWKVCTLGKNVCVGFEKWQNIPLWLGT